MKSFKIGKSLSLLLSSLRDLFFLFWIISRFSQVS